MTVQTAPAHRPASRPVNSPLAAHSHGTTAVAWTRMDNPGTSKSPRDTSIADFCDYLRTTNNRNGRPYEDATVENYVYAARALDRWMTTKGIDGDFTVADTALLNRFLRDYFRQHGQGGTHSQQRNMRHLFSYLAREGATPPLHGQPAPLQRAEAAPPGNPLPGLHQGPARGHRQRAGPRLRGCTRPRHHPDPDRGPSGPTWPPPAGTASAGSTPSSSPPRANPGSPNPCRRTPLPANHYPARNYHYRHPQAYPVTRSLVWNDSANASCHVSARACMIRT